MREMSKTVKHEIDGNEILFQIRKMNALDGSYMLKFVAEKLLPLVGGFQNIFAKQSEEDEGKTEDEIAETRTDMLMEMIPKALQTISKDELLDFEKQCLRLVDMMKPAGWQPVMMGDFFGVEEVEYDPIMALTLCYDVIQFNFAGFFAGRNLASILNPQDSAKPSA